MIDHIDIFFAKRTARQTALDIALLLDRQPVPIRVHHKHREGITVIWPTWAQDAKPWFASPLEDLLNGE